MLLHSLTLPLQTERLTLRLPTERDVAAIYFLRSDPNVNHFIRRQRPENHSDIETFIRERREDFRSCKSIYLVIQTEKHAQTVGTICLWNFSDDLNTAELGYDLHPEFHGQGIMSEAVQAVLNVGCNLLGFDTIEAYTHFENAPSIRMLNRNGFAKTDKRDVDVDTNVVFAIESAKRND